MNFLNSKFFTGLISVFLAWILFSVISLEFEKNEAKKEVKNVELKIENIKKSSQVLEKLISNFNSQAFLEREARSRLNYKKQGEEVVFVYRDSVSDTASLSEKFSLGSLSYYKKWWRWMLGF